jgi:predicted metal-binding membrane protein
MRAMDERTGSPFMALMPMGRWGPYELALCIAMWVVMMVAMMLPSAAPMLFMFHAMARRRFPARRAAARLAAFALGYLLVWTAFSVVAAVLQAWLHDAAVVNEAMVSASRPLDAALLVAAGVWQLVPAKARCLDTCRSPLAFLFAEWRDGVRGALMMGLRHGMFCVGCCWALMALLFVGGVMNLVWIALLAGVVLIEKLLPAGPWVAKAVGVALCLAGLVGVWAA